MLKYRLSLLSLLILAGVTHAQDEQELEPSYRGISNEVLIIKSSPEIIYENNDTLINDIIGSNESGSSSDLTALIELDESDELGELHESDEPNELDEYDGLGELDEYDRIGKLNGSDELVEPDELDESDEPGELDKSDELGELDESDEPGELDEFDEPGELDESDELGELDESDEPGELDESDEPGQLDESDEPGELSGSDELFEPGDLNESDKPVEPGEPDYSTVESDTSSQDDSDDKTDDIYPGDINDSINDENESSDGRESNSSYSDYVEFKEGNEDFSISFLDELAQLSNGQSLATSPFSVLYLLAQLALYTKGPSLVQLQKALNLQNDEQIRLVFTGLTDALNDQASVKFEIAARTYVSAKYNLSDAFLNDTKIIFRAPAVTLNFNNTEQAAETINSWVENKTNNLITDLVSPNQFDQFTAVVLVNAIYFKGNWSKQFNSRLTGNRDFYIDDKNVIQIPTMYQRNIFSYAQNDEYDFQLLSMPFVGRNFSLNIVLPNNVTGVPSLLTALTQDNSILNNTFQTLDYYSVDLYLPKMDIKTEINLKEILSNLGITGIFSDDSGIEGILKTPQNLTVTSGVQKAVFRVNEAGAEATATSAFTIGLSSARDPTTPVIFKADHPFIYFLVLNDLTLFCGVFEG